METTEMISILENKTGLKFGARKLTGSMKGYISFRPKKMKNIYPDIEWDLQLEFKAMFKSEDARNPTFVSSGYVDIYFG